MLSRTNSLTWIGDNIDEENPTVAWSKSPCNNDNNNNNDSNNVVDIGVDNSNAVIQPFKSMLDVENEWLNYNNNNNNSIRESLNFMVPFIDSSASCTPTPTPTPTHSPSPSVALNPTLLDPAQIASFFTAQGNNFGSNLSQNFGENDGFFTEGEMVVNRGNGGVLGGFSDFQNNNNNININNNNDGNINEIVSPSLGGNSHFSNAHLVQMGGNDAIGFGSGSGFDFNQNFRGFEGGLMNPSVFINRTSKMLKPLDNSAPFGTQPTLFQKRAALRKNFNAGGSGNENEIENQNEGAYGRKRKFDNISFDGPCFNYDSDDVTLNGGTNSNANSTGTGGGAGGDRGKKKGPPAKNLMAERRRRKKLNDRLYMLRSIVPKISKMDRASILGDAIEYLKELLQKISDLHNELESSPSASTLTQTPNLFPLTPTLPNLPTRIKEELYASPVPSPHAHANAQPARIEVRSRDGNALNIHMFCGRKPGLLLSIVRALDGIGLDVQQAVISCFNGFALDIFRAEPWRAGEEMHPEQIRALLMNVADFHGSNLVGN